MKRSGRLTLAGTIIAVVALVLGASSAQARWRIANGNDASDMTAPPGGTIEQTCTDQLRGVTGWTTFPLGNPEDEVLPSGAFSTVRYELWKAPPGFDDFAQAQAVFDDQGHRIGYTFHDDASNQDIPATLVVKFDTVARTRLVTPIGLPNGVYVYTAAPITQPLAGVQAGDVLGLKPIGGASFVTLAARNCTDTGDFNVSDFQGGVDNIPVVNLGTAGTSYNIRFRLSNAANQTVTKRSAVAAITFSPLACSTFSGNPTDPIEKSTTGPSHLKFSASKDAFVYRWKTPSTPGCYRLKTIFESGQHEIINFSLS
jgi:hypothetical protein